MKTKFFFSVLVLFVLGTLPSFGADESVTFSEQGYTNQQAVSSYSGTDFSIAFDKGSNSNAPKYYTSGTAIRAYGGNTMTFSSTTKTIAQITLTFGSSDGSNEITTNVGTYKNGTWTGSASSITFTIGGTSGNRRIAGAEVTYVSGGGSVAVESVTLDESAITLTEEETQTLTAIVWPADATDKNVTWESDDEDVATVSNIGVVTAVGAGDATITCKSVSDNTKSATCAVHVNASPYAKSSLIFTEACGGSGTANDGVEWTVESDAAESTFDSNRGVHYGTSSKAVSYIKIRTNEIDGTIAKVVVNTSGASGTSAVVSVAVDGTAFEIYGDKTSASIISTASDYTFTGSASGTILVSITQTSNTKAIYCKSIIVYYEAPAPAAVATPTFSLAAGSYLGAQNIEITCETQGAEIYYTLDGSDPSSASAHYTSSIPVLTTTTIKAIAIKGDDVSAIASATYTIVEVEHEGTEADPYSVADARTIIDVYGSAENVYVSGIVSEIVTAFNPTYGNISYNISSDGLTTSDQLEAFRGKSYNGENFTSADDIKKDDQVVVFGNLTKYNSTYEFAADNQLVSLVRTKAEAGLAYNVIAIEKNIGDEAFTNPLTNPNSLTVTYSSSDENLAVVDENTGEVTIGSEDGTVTITASTNGDATHLAGTATYTITINDPSLTKVTFDATIDIATDNTEGVTKSGINIITTHTDGKNDQGTDISYYQTFKNQTLSVTSTVGKIKKIDFVTTSASYSANGFEGVSNERWSGDADNVVLTASGNQVRMSKIIVSYVLDTREEAGLEYADTDVEKHVGDAAFINPLTNPNNLTVAYESSNTDVAEVANDGTVTIKAEGTATITASFAGDATYKPASVSYELTVEEAGLDKVTFDATIDYTADESTLTLSKGGFTLTFTGGAMNNKANYRLYKDKEMTLSSTDYLIKKIEFTCTSDNPITGFDDVTGLDKDNNQWTGETNTVELIASNKQVRIEKLVVHYVEDTRAASGLEWSTDAIVMMEGETFTPANLINPNNITASEITIESDNTDLATVSEGVVSLVENVIGNATITAKFAGNATYKPAEFSYTITVNDPTSLIITDPVSSLNFGSTPQDVAVEDKNIEVTLQNVATATVTITGDGAAAFSASPMALTASGTIVVSANPANIGTFNATLTISDNAGAAENKEISLSLKVLDPADVETPISTASRWEVATASDIADGLEVLITGVKGDDTYAMGSQANNNRTAVKASISEGVLAPGEGTMSFTLVVQDGDTYALRTSNGKYLYAASNSSNHLKTEDALDAKNNGLWAIAYENNEWSIVAQGENSHNIMRFNDGSSIFSCYSSGQKAVKLYKKAPIAPEVVDVTDSKVASNIPEGSDVTIEDDGELVVNTKNSFAKLIVKEGGKVTLSDKKLTVTGIFTIETSMGSGKSGELRGVKGGNFAVTGEAYIDITLGDNGNADKWHAFTVPFPVDALNGIFDLNGNKLTNETNYAIMDYHGDIRAQGKYGWKKFRGTLVPGTFYLMTVDGARTTYRMKMKAGSTIVAGNSKAVTAYSGAGATTDKGWNGIGNPTLAYGQVNVAVQVLDPVNYVYVTKDANSCNFIVGTPFFYQASATGTISMIEANASTYYAPIRKAVKTTEQIKVSLANENYTDNLFISASEDATADYQVGKDLVKMTMTNTPIVPQIFGVAYKTQLSMVHAPLVGDRANYTLNLYAPADGEYTISAQQTEDAIVYLTYEGSPIWNITAGEYNCDLQKGNNSGFGLMLVRRAPQVTTDIEGANQSQNGVRKLLINGQLFIEKEGKLFNVTGQRL